MLDRLMSRFGGTVYVQIYPNRFELRHIEKDRRVSAASAEPFSTPRLLVGEFGVAEAALRRGMRELHRGVVMAPSPMVVMHPMAKTEGGLSSVEDRVLRELAESAGARDVLIWVGPALSDHQILQEAYPK